MKRKIEKLLIEIALKVAKGGKGCLFVIEKNNVKYDFLINNDIKPFSIFENKRRTELLSTIDGAVIIDTKGNLKAYSVKIKNTKAFEGYGMRHSAGYTASLNGNTSILASEEDKKVRIFKNGKLIMQIDALERNIEKKTNEITKIFEILGAGTLGSIGTGLIFPQFGVMTISGVVIFGSAYYLINLIKEKIK